MYTPDLAYITTDELAFSLKPILIGLLQGQPNERTEIYNLLISRAAEPEVIAAITSILMPHTGDDDGVTQIIRGHIIYRVLKRVSFEQLQAYQNTIAAVNAYNTGYSKDRLEFYLDNMRRLERFMVEPEAVWVAEDWYDFVGCRTLADRVHTAEQMRPYMREMYQWFEDRNDLPYSCCAEQLARFPEAAAAVAAEVIDEVVAGKVDLERNVGRLNNIVDFMAEHIPDGEARVVLQQSIESLTQTLKKVVKEGSRDDYAYCLEASEEWLSELNGWETDESEEEENERNY
ncbi:hypothetical protein NW768_002845 [Fusarium equiseti]|uniref:DUF5071 domain-containing protein n=1 Tax=Fusarium equiseti TaxID=61235 RepID=A0ABQ8RKF7_FUSEQ|nr:hypothetical protein NW768_002845 [Fusarium equiseti]